MISLKPYSIMTGFISIFELVIIQITRRIIHGKKPKEQNSGIKASSQSLSLLEKMKF